MYKSGNSKNLRGIVGFSPYGLSYLKKINPTLFQGTTKTIHQTEKFDEENKKDFEIHLEYLKRDSEIDDIPQKNNNESSAINKN